MKCGILLCASFYPMLLVAVGQINIVSSNLNLFLATEMPNLAKIPNVLIVQSYIKTCGLEIDKVNPEIDSFKTMQRWE